MPRPRRPGPHALGRWPRTACWRRATQIPRRSPRAAWACWTGGRLTLEDAYAYAEVRPDGRRTPTTSTCGPARTPLMRSQFLGRVAWPGATSASATPTWNRPRPPLLLAGLRAGGRVAHRLPPAAQDGQERHGLRVFSVAALASPGLVKLSGRLLEVTLPGDEARALTALGAGSAPGSAPGRRAVDRGAPGPDGRGGRGGGAVAACRAGARRAGRGDPGRRAAGRGAGGTGGRGHARGRVGSAAGLGAPPCGRARGRRGRGAARAAAHRPPGS